jgi:hypothetical protein
VRSESVREARTLGRGRAGRTPVLMLALVTAIVAVVVALVITVAFLISSNS